MFGGFMMTSLCVVVVVCDVCRMGASTTMSLLLWWGTVVLYLFQPTTEEGEDDWNSSSMRSLLLQCTYIPLQDCINHSQLFLLWLSPIPLRKTERIFDLCGSIADAEGFKKVWNRFNKPFFLKSVYGNCFCCCTCQFLIQCFIFLPCHCFKISQE